MREQKTYLLGLSNMSDKEVSIMLRISTEGINDPETDTFLQPVDLETAFERVQLIDRMFTAMKSYRLLNKKRGLKDHLDKLINHSLGFETENLNSRKR